MWLSLRLDQQVCDSFEERERFCRFRTANSEGSSGAAFTANQHKEMHCAWELQGI